MSADGNLLRGELNPEVINEGPEVERLLIGFLNALLSEQQADGGKVK